MFAVRTLGRRRFGRKVLVSRLDERGIEGGDGRRNGFGRRRNTRRVQGRGLPHRPNLFGGPVENRIPRVGFGTFVEALEVHFTFPGALEIVGRPAKLRKALTQLATQLRKFARAKENQRSAKDDQQFSAAE